MKEQAINSSPLIILKTLNFGNSVMFSNCHIDLSVIYKQTILSLATLKTSEQVENMLALMRENGRRSNEHREISETGASSHSRCDITVSQGMRKGRRDPVTCTNHYEWLTSTSWSVSKTGLQKSLWLCK